MSSAAPAHDLVIIGAGTAGLSAATMAASHGTDVLVIEQLAPGGQVSTVDRIRNMPGFAEGIGGYELGPAMHQQAEEAGAAFLFDSIDRIEVDEAGFRVVGADATIATRAVIVAAGSSRRALNVPGEREFEGRGVSHCASCDGHFFRGKQVVVVGGGDSAFDEAEVLAEQAAVTIVHRSSRPVAQRRTVERVAMLAGIRILAESRVVAIEGASGVERVILSRGGGTEVHACEGVFVYVGLDPNSALVGDLVALDERGAIITDAGLQTSLPGLFVAGDIRSGATRLLASAAGEGAAAALAAVRHLTAG